jgi:hypothetical protein
MACKVGAWWENIINEASCKLYPPIHFKLRSYNGLHDFWSITTNIIYIIHCRPITSIKNPKQKKNMNATPKCLNNEFQIQMCWKERINTNLKRKNVQVMWAHKKPKSRRFNNSSQLIWTFLDPTMVCNVRPLIVVGEGGLKLDPKHNTNYNKFLGMGTLQTYQNNIISWSILILSNSTLGEIKV